MRRWTAVSAWPITLLITCVLAPAAAAQGPVDAAGNFGHDDSRDGTVTEIVSGFGPSGDVALDPIAQRFPNTYEYFDVVIPASGAYASFTVDIRWQDPRVDLDMYIHRRRPNGTYDPEYVAFSAQGATTEESAQIFNRLAAQPLQPGSVYRVFVDNWCSRDADPNPQTADPADTADCGIGAEVPDEDDFVGSVAFNGFTADNAVPRASITGPATGRTGQLLRFTASATDDDGITNYAFDLDGDGRFETNAGRSNVVAKRFDLPGTYNIGVRAVDSRNGAGYATLRQPLTITGPPLDSEGKPLIRILPSSKPIASFALGSPAFGGTTRRSVFVRYRLKETARVTLTVRRGNRTVKRLVRNRLRRGDRVHRVKLRPRGLRRGVYTVRLLVRTDDGRRQRLQLKVRRL